MLMDESVCDEDLTLSSIHVRVSWLLKSDTILRNIVRSVQNEIPPQMPAAISIAEEMKRTTDVIEVAKSNLSSNFRNICASF
jgi:hypothetical protein